MIANGLLLTPLCGQHLKLVIDVMQQILKVGRNWDSRKIIVRYPLRFTSSP